jgi:signal transduction histidine kinase
MLCWYWGSILACFAFQAQFQYGKLPIILSFGCNIIPCILISKIIFDTMSRTVPIRLYVNLWLASLVMAVVLNYFDFSFLITSLPVTLALGYIPLNTAYYALYKTQNETTKLHKFMGCVMLITFTHFINFSVFRMVPGTQLWGHAISLAIYQIYAVLIFALVLESYARKEKDRLQELVNLRTEELSNALSVKERLFRMVLHDIATPIQGQLWAIQLLKDNRQTKFDVLTKLSEMTNLIKNVVEQVRSIEGIGSGKTQIEPTPVDLDKCISDILSMFEGQLQLKNINFQINNNLKPETVFYADQDVFTTSVLANLISNAIKFSLENSTLILRAYEKDEKVIIELEDHGVGIPPELAFAIFDPSKKTNRKGTKGELGTGFGMIQVKSYVDHFGGKISLESRPMELYPMNHGTKVTLTMGKSVEVLH